MDMGELPLQCEPCSVGHNPYKVEAYGIPALIEGDVNTRAKKNSNEGRKCQGP